jgi:hypothetical protein
VRDSDRLLTLEGCLPCTIRVVEEETVMTSNALLFAIDVLGVLLSMGFMGYEVVTVGRRHGH